MNIPRSWQRLVTQALQEDRARQDITSRLLLTASAKACGVIQAKAAGVLAGKAVATAVFRALDTRCVVRWRRQDGAPVRRGEIVASLRGPARALLAGERVALNFLSRLSGIATLTHRFVQAVEGTGAKVYDTRKTTPGWRPLERYAVRCGGGYSHRKDLSQMILVKDNHWRLLGPQAAAALRRLHQRRRPTVLMEIEAQTLAQARVAVKAGANLILLDNLSGERLREAVRWIQSHRTHHRPLIEVSGGVTLRSVRSVARLGVERISIGRLTHSAPALDFSLELE